MAGKETSLQLIRRSDTATLFWSWLSLFEAAFRGDTTDKSRHMDPGLIAKIYRYRYICIYNCLAKKFCAEHINRSDLENTVELYTFAKKNNIQSFFVIHTHMRVYVLGRI